MRPRLSRHVSVAFRGLLTALLAAGITLSSSGTVEAAVPAPAPAKVPHIQDDTVQQRYQANRNNITAAARMATHSGETERAQALREMSHSDRKFLTFDGRGDGRAVEVLGDLAHADRVAVYVPGSDTTLDTYGAHGSSHPWSHAEGGAQALHHRIQQEAPHSNTAVVTWLGYDAPATVSADVLTDSRAHTAAGELRTFVAALHDLHSDRPTQVGLLCHSYGSVVCGQAAPHLNVSDIAVFGSPGLGVDSAADLHSTAQLWAGSASGDWIQHVPHTTIPLPSSSLGFGADPTSGDYGSRQFAAGDGGHGDYFKPGSAALHNLTRIATGHDSQVTEEPTSA